MSQPVHKAQTHLMVPVENWWDAQKGVSLGTSVFIVEIFQGAVFLEVGISKP
jgi:hypothetical protein